MVRSKGCHSIKSTVKLFLGRWCKILHQVAAFAKINTVSICFTKYTVCGCLYSDPQITERKLVIYIGFILGLIIAGGNLGQVKAGSGRKHPVFFFRKTTVWLYQAEYHKDQKQDCKKNPHDVEEILVTESFSFHFHFMTS